MVLGRTTKGAYIVKPLSLIANFAINNLIILVFAYAK